MIHTTLRIRHIRENTGRNNAGRPSSGPAVELDARRREDADAPAHADLLQLQLDLAEGLA
jgi:hypothetical protein